MRYSDIDALCAMRGKATSEKKLHGMAATSLHRLADGAIAMRYHDTDILTWYPDNTVKIQTGGWFTQTTARRIDDHLRGKTPDDISVSVGNDYAAKDGVWHIITRRRNLDRSEDAPYYTRIANIAYREGARVNLDTGAIMGGTMVDYAEHNKRIEKAIKAYLKGMTLAALAQSGGAMDDTLEADVLNGVYSYDVFESMVYASHYNNPNFILQVYVNPLFYGQQNSSAAHNLDNMRRDLARYLRSTLLIGPVSIVKNFGQPRRIA